ncbi:histidine kinase [candidate division KSB1 bacterium]
MNIRFLKYLAILLLFSTPALSQDGVIRIDRNVRSFVPLKEIKFIRTDIRTFEILKADSLNWGIMLLDRSAEESINSEEGIIWLFSEINIAEPLGNNRDLSVNLVNIGSENKVYWDMRELEGKTSYDKSEEHHSTSGISLFRVPKDLAEPGIHELYIRAQITDKESISRESGISIGFYDYMMERQMEQQIEQRYLKIFFMAVLFASAVFSLIMFFGFNKRIEYLFFCLFCLANSRLAYFLPFSVLEKSIEARLALNIGSLNYILFSLANISLLLYLLIRFSFHRSHRFFSSLVIAISAAVFFLFRSTITENMHIALIAFLSYLIVLFAFYKRKKYAAIMLIGLTGLNVLTYLGVTQYLVNGYFNGIVFFVVCISVLFSKEIADQYRRHREAILKTARLENELLKRNIQPHFILNTLTSLQEIIEQDKRKAVEFIQALGEEFQVFSRISGKKLIAIIDEIKICRAHLKIMEYRKGSEFELNTEGVDGTEKIPPGIFHTLIENGTTHGYPGRKNGRFSIVKEKLGKTTKYIVFNDSDDVDPGKKVSKGTGLKYIEARLEESFPGLWNLSYCGINGGWEVIIEIQNNRDINK